VLPWRDGLEPDSARGWSPAGSGWLERKEVIACVVITRGGSPNGSRRVARRAAALLNHNLTVGIDQAGAALVFGLVESCGCEFRSFALFSECDALTRPLIGGDYGQYRDRGWWWSWLFTTSMTGRRAEGGAST
jgi:hypothetical protein